ncbi:MAG TPA: hypothetical protein PK308_08570 [Phycisphaerales bacterium]|nr:hypothetical protein [Phycisphaerales bacterium]
MEWMEEARQLAAQAWCDEETKHLVMQPELAEAAARRIAAWMCTAAQHARNEEFYRGLLDRCAEHLGPDVFVSEDGSVQASPLRLKVPELVAAMAAGVWKPTVERPEDPERFSRCVTPRGFQKIVFTSRGENLEVQESSAIGDYADAFDNPGSSYLWVRWQDAFELDREQAAELHFALGQWLQRERLFSPAPVKPAEGGAE